MSDAATAVLIDVLVSVASGEEKAAALLLLGDVAFSSNKVAAAVDAWKELTTAYPLTSEANAAQDRLAAINELFGQLQDEAILNATAAAYLKNGDFWSDNFGGSWTIDTSWIRNTDAAVYWYSKVIRDFPGTAAAERAYVKRLRMLLEWAKPGPITDIYGVVGDFDRFMPQAMDLFAEFERSFPSSTSLQAIRFQIAHAYWVQSDLANARSWLSLVVSKGGDRDGFYVDLAKRRLENMGPDRR